MNKASKEKILNCLKTNVKLFNRYRKFTKYEGLDFRGVDLQHAHLRIADLQNADLQYADLQHADLQHAYLRIADLQHAYLQHADFQYADLQYADLQHAHLQNAVNMAKIMGVKRGGYYYKRFEDNLENKGYKFKVGLNELRDGEVFASDERVLCSYPGFHFASKSWCDREYPDRPYEALIRIPEDAQINEPWATDGKASADKIEIVQIWDTTTGEDVTEKFRKEGKKK